MNSDKWLGGRSLGDGRAGPLDSLVPGVCPVGPLAGASLDDLQEVVAQGPGGRYPGGLDCERTAVVVGVVQAVNGGARPEVDVAVELDHGVDGGAQVVGRPADHLLGRAVAVDVGGRPDGADVLAAGG